MARARPRFNGRELTEHLRQLSLDAETMCDNGEVVTKAEALARLLWKKALGYKAMGVNRHTQKAEEIYYPPEAWAIQMIWERMEGKVAPVEPEKGDKLTVADKIDDLAKSRINAMAETVAAKKGPPPIKRKAKNGNTGTTDPISDYFDRREHTP